MKHSIGLLILAGLILTLGATIAVHHIQASRGLSINLEVLDCKIHCNEHAQVEIARCETLQSAGVSCTCGGQSRVDINQCIFDANAVYQTCKRDCENAGGEDI